MTSKAIVDDFMSQQKLAVVGVSRSSRKFGNVIYKELKGKGYKVFPVNPNVETIESDSCYPALNSLPEPVDGAVVVVKPNETEKIVKEASEAGIKRVWIQQGAESKQAIKYCEDNHINCIHGECILMFAEPLGFIHKFHRGIWKIVGKLPK
jgi:predicted CoA-binding protein